MLKGHVQIELHNHKTGLRDRIEKDNLLTNALEYAMTIYGCSNKAPNTVLTPIPEMALGGIMLFDNTLTEDADNILFPDSAKFIGCANQTVDTTHSHRGSINALESGAIENGYMNVWDFSTAQANGIIKSIALTHHNGGGLNPGMPMRDWEAQQWNDTYCNLYPKMLYWDADNGEAYTAGTVNGVRKVVKNRLVTGALPIDMGAGNGYDERSWNLGEVVADSPVSDEQRQYVHIDGITYWGRVYTQNNINYFELNAIDIEDWTNEVLFDDLEIPYNNNVGWMVTPNGYLYINFNREDYNKILKVKISTKETTQITVSDARNIRNVIIGGNNLLYFTIQHYENNTWVWRHCLLYPDDTVIIIDADVLHLYGGYYPHFGSKLAMSLVVSNQNVSYVRRTSILNYLGSICNLETPVEKTASMSMKVKYSLTNV